MAKYRRKPLQVEAFRYGYDAGPEWYHAAVSQGLISGAPDLVAVAVNGQWSIGHNGDFILKLGDKIWICEEDEFNLLYERVVEG